MASLFSYLISFLAILYWIFRIVVCFNFSLAKEFPFLPLDFNQEVILLFLSIPCFIAIFKRNVIGSCLYFGLYGIYFGQAVYNQVTTIITNGATPTAVIEAVIMACGVLIPLFSFLDVLLNKNRVGTGLTKQTDWFYKNEKFDREFDERADRNEYKF